MMSPLGSTKTPVRSLQSSVRPHRHRGVFVNLVLFWVGLTFLSGCAVYNTTSDASTSDLMLGGYDPVAYFDAPAPMLGQASLEFRHRYGTYRFASAANLALFRADPDRYAPQYGGFCAKGVAYAIRAGGDPRVYEIHDNRLFIFAVPYARDYWRTDRRDFIETADNYWARELRDSPVRWTNIKRWVIRVPHYKTYPEEFRDYEARTGKPAPR